MQLSTLFVMDPLDRINVAGDSTYMLMLEARRRGWPVWYCTPGDLYAADGLAWGGVRPVEVRRPSDGPPFEPGPLEHRPLSAFDVVWMRKDPPFDMDYIFTTYLLDLVGPRTLALNRPASLRNRNEKMFALALSRFGPPTLVSRDVSRLVAWVRASEERSVIKPWDGNGGRGVLVTHAEDENLRSMVETLTSEGRAYIIAQRYLPAIKDGDKRIILIDGEPRGWMNRVPQRGDHRGNMHAGAKVAACELTARDQEICATLGPILREEGLLFVGIDVIGGNLTEINVTSPTGIQEINRLMGTRLEVEVTDAVLARFSAAAAAGGTDPSAA